MLGQSVLIAIVSTAKPSEAREFYTSVLGLEFVREEPQAMVFRCNDQWLRMQIFDEIPPPRGSALGWEVQDIRDVVGKLHEKGVATERYDFMPQDDLGIATFPNGDQVAWFHDPDGNILSVAQLVK